MKRTLITKAVCHFPNNLARQLRRLIILLAFFTATTKSQRKDLICSKIQSTALMINSRLSFFSISNKVTTSGPGFSYTPVGYRELTTCWGTLQIRIWFVRLRDNRGKPRYPFLPLKQTNKHVITRAWDLPLFLDFFSSMCILIQVNRNKHFMQSVVSN